MPPVLLTMSFGFEKAEFFALFLETFFLGVFFTLCISTFIVLIRCTKDRRRNGFLQLVAGVMLVIATCHLIIVFMCAFRAYTDDSTGPASYYNDAATSLDIAKGVLYALQTILGDLILLWRCYVAYDQRPISIVIPIVLLLGCFAMQIPIFVSFSHPRTAASLYMPTKRWPVVAYAVLTVSISIYCTVAISWRIYRMARTAPYIQPVLLGLIESGTLYTSTVLAFLCAFLARLPAYMIPFDMLPPVMGICFCLIILQGVYAGAAASQDAGSGSKAAPRLTGLRHSAQCSVGEALPLTLRDVDVENVMWCQWSDTRPAVADFPRARYH